MLVLLTSLLFMISANRRLQGNQAARAAKVPPHEKKYIRREAIGRAELVTAA